MYFAYVGGVNVSAEYPNEAGMIYYTKYKKRNETEGEINMQGSLF